MSQNLMPTKTSRFMTCHEKQNDNDSGNHVRAMNPTIANNTGVATSSSRMMTDTQSNPKHVLVQKLQGAMQNLRREREQEYREKVEAEERLRLATEEQASLATIVAGLKAKQENLRKRKTTVESNLVQLEADVKDLTDKVRHDNDYSSKECFVGMVTNDLLLCAFTGSISTQ